MLGLEASTPQAVMDLPFQQQAFFFFILTTKRCYCYLLSIRGIVLTYLPFKGIVHSRKKQKNNKVIMCSPLSVFSFFPDLTFFSLRVFGCMSKNYNGSQRGLKVSG